MKPEPVQVQATADIVYATQAYTLDNAMIFAQACALNRIAQAIERFAAVVEKATKQ